MRTAAVLQAAVPDAVQGLLGEPVAPTGAFLADRADVQPLQLLVEEPLLVAVPVMVVLVQTLVPAVTDAPLSFLLMPLTSVPLTRPVQLLAMVVPLTS